MSQTGFNIRTDIADVIRRKGVGLAGDGSVLSRPVRIFHRVNITPAGNQQISFFNEAKSTNVTNMDQASMLSANMAMIVVGMRFSFTPGFDRDGKRLGIAAPTAAELQASALNLGMADATNADKLGTIWKWHEKTRELLGQGLVELRIGDRTIFSVFGLDAFPSGRGVVTSAALGTAIGGSAVPATTVQQALTSIANGAPVAGNAFRFISPLALVSGQQFSVNVSYTGGVDFTELNLGPLNALANAKAAGVLMCELEGELLSAASA